MPGQVSPDEASSARNENTHVANPRVVGNLNKGLMPLVKRTFEDSIIVYIYLNARLNVLGIPA